MNWNKYIINTTTKDADLVCATLYEFGITDVQIEDNVQLTDEEFNQLYAALAKELPADDGTCKVNFYLDEDGRVPAGGVGTGDSPTLAEPEGEPVDLEALNDALNEAAELYGIEPVSVECLNVNTEDWENNWKQYFKPFAVENIIIKPTWEEVPADIEAGEHPVVINIDPGMAFGTGMHETTRLCMRGLSKYMDEKSAAGQPVTVLDLGCGSGILGISALKLGAESVTAIDIDEQAVKTAYENFELNTAEDEQIMDPDGGAKTVFSLHVGDVLADSRFREKVAETKYDIVVANILAEVIEPLCAHVDQYIKAGGVFVSSGILKEKEQLIIAAVNANAGLEYIESVFEGDWVSVVARKK